MPINFAPILVIMKPDTDHVKRIISTLPDKPGVYQYYGIAGELIYIGKAKSLKKRVSSYFNKQLYESSRIARLVKQITDIKVIIVDSEMDALLLVFLD